MSEIFLDGEQVQFEGPAPAKFSDLLSAIEHAVAASGRVLVGVSIDSRRVDGDPETEVLHGARRIEFVSVPLEEAIRRLAETCRERAAALRGPVEALACDVLREPWAVIAPRLVEAGEPLAGLLRDLGSLGDASPYSKSAHELETGLAAWIDAVAARDAAAVCLCLEKAVLPALARVARADDEGAVT